MPLPRADGEAKVLGVHGHSDSGPVGTDASEYSLSVQGCCQPQRNADRLGQVEVQVRHLAQQVEVFPKDREGGSTAENIVPDECLALRSTESDRKKCVE